jgi:hypothetical protein
MTDLDEAFVDAVAQTALRVDHRGTDVLLRAPGAEPAGAVGGPPVAATDGDDDAPAGHDVELDGGRPDIALEVVVGGRVVGAIVPVDDGYGVLMMPEDGEEPSGEQETLEDALDELGV